MPKYNYGREPPSDEELGERLAKMTPVQRTRYYAKCMTNGSTPDSVISFLRQYRKENRDAFAPDSVLSFMRDKGTSFENWRRSDSWKRDSYKGPSGIGTITIGEYEDARDAYGELGAETVSRYRGSSSRPPKYSDGGYRARKRRPASEERSASEIAEVMEGLGSNVRRSQYYSKVMANGETNPRTRARLEEYREGNPEMFATDRQIDSYKRRSSRPHSEARTMNDIAMTMGSIRSKGARTRYLMSVMDNPDSNETTKRNLERYRREHPGMFASEADAMRFSSSRAYAKQEEFDAMSGKEKHYFTSARGRSRAENSSYALKVLTNPNSDTKDRIAITKVVRRFPQMFFRSRYGGRRE